LYVDVICSILAFFQVKILNLFHALIITDFLSLFLVILYPYVFFFSYIFLSLLDLLCNQFISCSFHHYFSQFIFIYFVFLDIFFYICSFYLVLILLLQWFDHDICYICCVIIVSYLFKNCIENYWKMKISLDIVWSLWANLKSLYKELIISSQREVNEIL
jgi:hypothetical protein